MTPLLTPMRSSLSSLGIRERLVLLVLAMLLPWIALFATTYSSYERDRDRDTRARLTDLATQVGARVDDQVVTIEAILLTVAHAAATDTARVEDNETHERYKRTLF